MTDLQQPLGATDRTPAVPPPELTVRAVATGMAIGALLTPCNIYSGLKIGWSFNMSIAAGLLGFGLWRLAGRAAGARPWGMHENNINQTAASSAASIISGGLVAPIPAWTILTGETLPWPLLAFWVFTVSSLGIVVAAGLRNQLLLRDGLRFPAGTATAVTLREIHTEGAEAMRRLRALAGAAAIAGGLKLVDGLVLAIPKITFPVALPPIAVSKSATPLAVTPANLGLGLDPSLLMVGFGAIIGLRAGISLALGAVVAWVFLGPAGISRGWAEAGPPDPDASWFAPMVEYLIWPGVALMVAAALTSIAISLAGIVARRRAADGKRGLPATIPVRAFAIGLLGVGLLSGIAQTTLFGIGWWEAAIAVLLSFLLAMVVARVTGETGIAPIGAMGKITQISFAAITPHDVTTNLMSANVTGGAAGQASDLMDDLRTGQMIGATPKFQVVAQVFGVLTGALVGAFAYLLLVPDPAAMLITAEWPAPAVATWKAVAEVLSQGLDTLPEATVAAMALGAAFGIVLALGEKLAPEPAAAFLPSAPALGLAFVIPASISFALFAGAVAAAIVKRLAPNWAERRLVVVAAGLVAGESLAGIVLAGAGMLN